MRLSQYQGLLNENRMKNYNRDLLLLYKADVYNEDLLQREVEHLHQILLGVERNEVFCTVHELARRSRITQKSRVILKAVRFSRLRPFHFLINKFACGTDQFFGWLT